MRSFASAGAFAAVFALLMAGAVTPPLRAQAPVPPPMPVATAPAPSTPASSTPAASTPALSSPALSLIKDVRRDVLPEAVRITVELDREVPFYQERIEKPSRVFLDLKGTRTTAKLVDADFKFDLDVVRDIRLGRHPNNTTRIVIDLEGVSRYSVYTLYSPYRIIIDCERGTPEKKPGVVYATKLPETTQDIRDPGSLSATPAPPLPLKKTPGAISSAPSEREPGSLSPAPAAPAANSGGTFSVARQLGLGVSKIVIDAGHGGHDPGAAAFGVSEAELVLDVALRLEQLLKQRPGFETVLTRRTDEFVTLEERTGLANRESADLFLSIHANASSVATAGGVETYFLNFALNRQAEAVAARENAASGLTMNSLPGIVKAITLNSKLNESRDFATLVQKSMVKGLQPSNKALKDLGVKQAPFMVLIGASMPSVLAEISFVTNRAEARLLKTSAYRQKIAESLLAGIVKYQQALKKVQTASLSQ
jgi:N-acetylmuramoyl-L-alanine amidase